MSPIRVGFVGLSTKGWAAGAHLPYLKQSSKYRIVGLLNSSKASGEAAIAHYGLPASTKAYASPDDLAADPEVDLVVVSVRTDKHLIPAKAAVSAGKDCYVEWPLGRNVGEAHELGNLAREKGVRTMIGYQGRREPVINKVKQLVQEGAIGRVLSSTMIVAAGGGGATDTLQYLNEKAVGSNLLSIHFGHTLDYILYALGDLSSYSGIVSTQRPESIIVDGDGNYLRTVIRETPDNLTLQGSLKESGGTLSIHLRGGPPFKGEPGLIWRIYGEKGEMQVTSESSFLTLSDQTAKIQLHDHASKTVRTIDWTDLTSFGELPVRARNVGQLYEAFADGRTTDYAQWDRAVAMHELLSNLEETSNTGVRFKSG